MTTIKTEHNLICSVCGKDAAWNTPVIDMELNVYCPTCGKEKKDILLYGIQQHLKFVDSFVSDPGRIVWMKNGVVIRCDIVYQGIKGKVSIYQPKYSFTCWTDGGQTAYPLTLEEKMLAVDNIESLLDLIYESVSDGIVRCTTCGKNIRKHDIAGRPLFAGLNYDSVAEKPYLEIEMRSI